MVSPASVEQQLKRLGRKFTFFGRPEIRELSNILVPGEVITHCLNGFYHGGMAVMCATDQRLLLIDKKVFFLSMEDIRYDMITEIDFSSRVLTSYMTLHTITKELQFRSFNAADLRKMTHLVQEKIMQIRNLMQQPQSPSAGEMFHSLEVQQAQQARPVRNPLSAMLMRPRIGKFTLKTIR